MPLRLYFCKNSTDLEGLRAPGSEQGSVQTEIRLELFISGGDEQCELLLLNLCITSVYLRGSKGKRCVWW